MFESHDPSSAIEGITLRFAAMEGKAGKHEIMMATAMEKPRFH
jgi:hypothetical protein